MENLSNLKYQYATYDDLDEIVLMYQKAISDMKSTGIFQWDEIYPNREILNEDIKKKQLIKVIFESSIVATFVVNSEYDGEYLTGNWNDSDAKFIVVHRLCVNSNFQNQRIAHQIMQYVELISQWNGVQSIRLDCYLENPYAMKLYTNEGYRTVGYADWRKGRFVLMEKVIDTTKAGLVRGQVSIEKYNLLWNTIAKSTIETLKVLLEDVAVDIQHVGSTAIQGIKAKPIIDIAVGVRNLEDISAYMNKLEERGIIYRGEDVESQKLFVIGDFKYDTRTHHIHIIKYGGSAWNNYINFRDYLNSHIEKAKEYDELKEKLVQIYYDNRVEYTEGKKNLINVFLTEAREFRKSKLYSKSSILGRKSHHIKDQMK